MYYKIIRICLVSLVFIVGYGCTSNSYLQKIKPLSNDFSKYENIYVSMDQYQGGGASDQSFNQVKSVLSQQLIKRLTDSNKFKIVSDEIPSDIKKKSVKMHIIIEDLNDVNVTSSIVLGVHSGNARLKVLSKFIDLDTGLIIGEVRVGSHTRSTAGVLRGGTETLLSAVSSKLAALISGTN